MVLLVEADRASGALLAGQLLADGYRVELARSVAHARLLARAISSGAPHPARLEVGALEIDLPARAVAVAGRPVALRPLEFDLLVHLAHEPRRVFARRELLAAVWGYSAATTRTLDSTASRLRIKLAGDRRDTRDMRPSAGAAGSSPRRPDRRWVIGVRGVGYRLI